jgi:galactokinase/mevalonate kinase-like predicted kinase
MESSRETVDIIHNLSTHVEDAWSAIKQKSITQLGKSFNLMFEEIRQMIPEFAPDFVMEKVETYRKESLGVFLMGAGGGGYTLLVSETRPRNSLSFKIVR